MTSGRETALTLARNLKRLMADSKISQLDLAKSAGIGQSTLSALLDESNPLELNPRSTTIEQLAGHFDIPVWQLLIPDLPLDLLTSKKLTQLIEHYRNLPEVGRASVDRIAESEARYAAAPKPEAPPSTPK